MTPTAFDFTLIEHDEFVDLTVSTIALRNGLPGPIAGVLNEALDLLLSEADRRLADAPPRAIFADLPALVTLDERHLRSLLLASQRCVDGSREAGAEGAAAFWASMTFGVACELERRGFPVLVAMSPADHRTLVETHALERLADLPDPRPDGEENNS